MKQVPLGEGGQTLNSPQETNIQDQSRSRPLKRGVGLMEVADAPKLDNCAMFRQENIHTDGAGFWVRSVTA